MTSDQWLTGAIGYDLVHFRKALREYPDGELYRMRMATTSVVKLRMLNVEIQRRNRGRP